MSGCPNPTKSRFATRAAAVNASQRVDLRANLQLTPYECVCTWWHLTKGNVEEIPDPASADRAAIERLASLPLIDFRGVVAEDARGLGDPGDRAALRHLLNLPRWKKQLGELIADVEQQLRERKGDKTLAGHDWRKRALGYRDVLLLRASECKRLSAEAHAQMVKTDGFRRRDAEIAAATGATVKELRMQAGELAVARLINAHGVEFSRYVAEEYEAMGLHVPERVSRHVRGGDAA